jgi:hypothetical protein
MVSHICNSPTGYVPLFFVGGAGAQALANTDIGADDLGCIWIDEVWEHHLFGICWYTTTKIYSSNCNKVL